MAEFGGNRKGFYRWLSNIVERYSGWFILATVIVTVLLAYPMVFMAPDETASDNPTTSDVVKWSQEIADTLPSEVYTIPFIIEARDGDILNQADLYELFRNEEKLRSGGLAPFLYNRYSEVANINIEGVYSLADSVDTALRTASNGFVNLENATDDQVKQAVEYILDNPLTSGMEIELSVDADYQEGPEGQNIWRSSALLFVVVTDREKVQEDYPASIGEEYTSELALEHYGREVQRVLRGEQAGYRLWGVYIDQNLEIADESRISGIMLVISLVLMLVLIMFIFRSWIITLFSGLGLGMLIVWLKGASNLIGLKSSIILDLIVPIAILVLGIDYAIHALFRYREEKEKGNDLPRALGLSTYGVGNALVLAMLTTIIAFGANASSGIESVVGFGIAASIAILASFIILGLFVPALVMRYEAWRGKKTISLRVKENPSRGLWIASAVDFTSRRWFVTLPVILAITGVAVVGWLHLDTKMDPKEAFDARSDLIVGLDKLDEHVAQKAGEPAYLYIRGDFTLQSALKAILATISAMDDDEHVARRLSDGKPDAYAYLFDFLAAVVGNDYAREQIESAAGISITDSDGDLIPDTPEQLRAVYNYITVYGIPQDETTMFYTSMRIRESFVYDAGGKDDATLVIIGVPGTREQAVVEESSGELKNDMNTAMRGVTGISFYGLTGDAYVRDAQFSAITDSLNRSLIIAVLACFLLLLIVFRSLRYAVIILIPVLLVACWLYGFMYIIGYHLNMMTATIAAISIGVGIDFSIHYTARYRQELALGQEKLKALYETSRHTGMALFGTALSTALGFTVIAFAPMPMFSAFGILTAMMIVLSFLMALFALPGLLLLFTRSGSR